MAGEVLGAHPIFGIDESQQVFQLILEGQQAQFPPLSLDTAPPPLPMDRRAVAGYELRRPVADGSLALTWSLDQEPALDVWDLTSGQADEPLVTIDGFEGWFTPGGGALWVNALFDAVPVQLWDLQTGERADELLTGLASAWQLTQSNDGSLVLVNERGDSAVVFDLGASTGVSSMRLYREFDGQTGEVEVAGQIVSVYGGCENDGSLGTQFVVDLDQYALRASIPHQAGTSALSLDGRLVATQIGEPPATLGQQIVFMDGSTLEHLDRISDAHDGGINDLAINAEGTLLASAGVDGFVRVWDIETRTVVHQIPISNVGGVGGVAFLESGEHIAASNQADGELRIVALDTGELLDIARTRLTRTFTETECATYRIDPCPTLEDIQAG